MMKLFIDLWSDSLIVERTPPWAQREQDALTYMIVNHPYLLERVGFVRQRLINAYVMGLHMWVEGEFLVHFAGCWYDPASSVTDTRVDSRCSEYFDQFWTKRKQISVL